MEQCWGCGQEIHEGDYCEVCQVSIRLIQKMQEHGTRVLWTVPEIRAEKKPRTSAI